MLVNTFAPTHDARKLSTADRKKLFSEPSAPISTSPIPSFLESDRLTISSVSSSKDKANNNETRIVAVDPQGDQMTVTRTQVGQGSLFAHASIQLSVSYQNQQGDAGLTLPIRPEDSRSISQALENASRSRDTDLQSLGWVMADLQRHQS